MKRTRCNVVALSLLGVGVIAVGTTGDARPQGSSSQVKSPSAPAPRQGNASDRTMVDQVLRQWPAGPQLAGQETIAKYGLPDEVSSARMIWRDAGPYKRIMLTREQLPHDFPLPHMDYLEHTISYEVPTAKADEVHAFDASITIYRVGGELSARCDLESNNVLTLNLAHDIVRGKKSVAQARKQFGQIVMQRTLGKSPASAMALQFQPMKAAVAADVEKVTIPGAPVRAAAGSEAAKPGTRSNDAEIMAMLVALDQDEVHAAMVAKEKKLSKPILDYATLLHQHHGQNVLATVQLGMKIRVRPMITPAVQRLHAKHAAGLARVVALDGDAFGRAFLDLMIKGHQEALQMVGQQLQAVNNDQLEAHLTSTQQQLALHLQQAQQLRGEAGPPRTSRR